MRRQVIGGGIPLSQQRPQFPQPYSPSGTRTYPVTTAVVRPGQIDTRRQGITQNAPPSPTSQASSQTRHDIRSSGGGVGSAPRTRGTPVTRETSGSVSSVAVAGHVARAVDSGCELPPAADDAESLARQRRIEELEVALAKQSQDLEEERRSLEEKAEELRMRAESVDMRERGFPTGRAEAEHAARVAALEEREKALDARESQLNDRAAELDAVSASIDRREKASRKIVSRAADTQRAIAEAMAEAKSEREAAEKALADSKRAGLDANARIQAAERKERSIALESARVSELEAGLEREKGRADALEERLKEATETAQEAQQQIQQLQKQLQQKQQAQGQQNGASATGRTITTQQQQQQQPQQQQQHPHPFMRRF